MKKLFLIITLFFNVVPHIEDGSLIFFSCNSAKAQSLAILAQQMANYLNSLNDGKAYWVVGNHIANNGDCSPLPSCSFPLNSYLNDPQIRSDFERYRVQQNLDSPPESNEYENEEENDDVVWSEIEFMLDNKRSEARLEAFAAIEWWQTNGGQEPINQAPPCTEGTMFTIDFTYDFYEADVAPPTPNSYDGTSGPSNLACSNKFLLGGNIIQFTSGQLSSISNYSFGDGRLYSVQLSNGDNYERTVKYDVIEQTMSYDSYNSNCPDDFQTVKYNLLNRRGSYQYVCFPNIYYLGGVELHTSTNSSIDFFKGVPDTTLSGYTFVIPDSNIVAANPGDSVLGMTNGSYSCMALDCAGVQNGTAYTDSCGRCVGGNTGRIDCIPCDSVLLNLGDSLNAYLNKSEFQDSLNKFKQNTAADSVEKAISLGTDSSTSTFKTTPIKIAVGSTQVDLINTWPGIKIFKMIHFHPISDMACFSAGDFYSLSKTYNNSLLRQITSHYAYGAYDSSWFAMTIVDSLAFSKFVLSHPISLEMGADHGFDTSRAIGKDFRRAYLQFKGANYSDDDAFTQATAYVMAKYNTGLAFYRKKKGESKFTKINTKVAINGSGNETFSNINCL